MFKMSERIMFPVPKDMIMKLMQMYTQSPCDGCNENMYTYDTCSICKSNMKICGGCLDFQSCYIYCELCKKKYFKCYKCESKDFVGIIFDEYIYSEIHMKGWICQERCVPKDMNMRRMEDHDLEN